jgi:L-fuculose-phosphate aldolase
VTQLTDEEVFAAVLAAAKKMYAKGLVEGTAGNVSGRLSDGNVAMTPSSLSYDAMTLDDLVVVDLDGEKMSGERSATTEKSLHLACYRAYPEVRGVIHCHALHSSMFALVHQPIPAAVEEFVVFVGGEVRVCDYRTTGTDELADVVAAGLADRSAALMANHGMVTIGKDPEDALHAALVVEHNAHIVWGARALGEVVPIPEDVNANFANIYDFIRHQMWSGA